MSLLPRCSHTLTSTYPASGQKELQGEVEGPQSSSLLSLLFWGQVPGGGQVQKEKPE